MDFLTNWIFELLYSLQKTICYIIDFIRQIFYMLCGIKPVNINGESTDLLSHFILSETVKRTFLIILLIAFILLAIFTMIAIIRSEYANGENKKSKARIFGKTFQSFSLFLIIPFVLIAGITLTNSVMGAINQSMSAGLMYSSYNSTIGGQILVTSGQFAFIGDSASRTSIESMFISGELNYFDMSVVSQYYNLRSIDYLVGLLGSTIIMVMFVMSVITFIQRIFDIILLYIIAPVSVSTIPVDEGNRFKLWRDMIISKVLSAYGIILTMNLFFLIIPQVSQIIFFNDAFKNGIVQILFLIGGAFAVTKGNLVIAQLTGNSSGGNEVAQIIRNVQTGSNITKGIVATGGGLLGRIIGGKRYLNTKKTSGSFVSGISESFKINPNAKLYTNHDKVNKLARVVGTPTRIATMPIGMIKDLSSGGVVGFSKNLGRRIKNVATGDSFINQPQGRKIIKEDEIKTTQNSTNK